MSERPPRVSWTVEEYTHREKNADWFWALGIIALAGAVTAFILHNYLFAIFIVIAGIILGFFAQRQPDMITVAINEKGIRVREYLYPFERLHGFGIDEHELGAYLLIESDRAIMPVISIPLPEEIDPDALAELLSTRIPEKKLKEPISHRLMEHLGF